MVASVVSTRNVINRLPCIFEKALLARCAVCDLAVQPERNVICTAPLSRAACGQFYGLLRKNATFAIGEIDVVRIPSEFNLLKIQCGGLAGLRVLMDPDAPAPNVCRLIRAARERFGNLAALPFPQIVRGVSAWKHS